MSDTSEIAERIAGLIVGRAQQAPAIAGWPYTKRESLRAYFGGMKIVLDLIGDRLCQEGMDESAPGCKLMFVLGKRLRGQAAATDVARLVDAYAREEKAVAP